MIKKDKLQIEASAATQHLFFFRMQKTMLVLLIIFLLGAFFGLTGPGFLEKKIARHPGENMWIQYDWFGRRNASTTIQIHLHTSAQRRTTDIAFSQKTLEVLHINQITPAPLYMEIKDQFVLFHFLLASQNSLITFWFEPQVMGFMRYEIGLPGQPVLKLKQFIYP